MQRQSHIRKRLAGPLLKKVSLHRAACFYFPNLSLVFQQNELNKFQGFHSEWARRVPNHLQSRVGEEDGLREPLLQSQLPQTSLLFLLEVDSWENHKDST